jgi:hypothetical protein
VLITLLATADPSKVPFYIAGGGLAVWAVAVAAFGITHPSFPGSQQAQRGVILVSLILVVLAIAMAIATSK